MPTLTIPSKEPSPLLPHATLLVRPRPVQARNADITRVCSSRANIADGTSGDQVLSNVLEFSAQPLRSERTVSVEARYKHIRCTNSKL